MNSKECLKRIDETNYLTEREHKEFLSAVENDLDKLKQFEKENEELKEANKFLLNMSVDLHNRKEKLKKAIEIILKYKINPSTFIFTRKIYKDSCGKDLTFEKAHSLLEFDGTQEEYDLLKEVLCDENS